METHLKAIFLLLLLFVLNDTYAQDTDRSIPTAMSYLLTRPDARSSGMGDVGVATPADVHSLYSNPSKIAFSSNKTELGLCHVPLIPFLIDDASVSNISGFRKVGEKGVLGISLYYLTYGQVDGRDDQNVFTGFIFPKEYTFDFTYARKISDHFSLGLTTRFLHSDIYSGAANNVAMEPSSAFSADVSAYFEKVQINGLDGAKWAFGAVVSNIGTKVKYTQSGQHFLPTNLKLGGAYSFLVDGNAQRLTISTEFNKLLVPTPPIYDNNGQIVEGKDPNRSVVSAIFTSFGDAPGGFSEELKEISMGTGLEYLLDESFAFRTGYFYEHQDKGNRQHFALGTGVKYRNFNFDLAYIVPTANRFVLKNSLKFSLGMGIK